MTLPFPQFIPKSSKLTDMPSGVPAPVLYWPFNDGSGVTARDISGGGHDFSNVGSWLSEGPFGCAGFIPSSSTASLGLNTGAFTLSFFLKYLGTSADYLPIIADATSGVGRVAFYFASTYAAGIIMNKQVGTVYSAPAAFFSKWKHVVLSYDGSAAAKVYIDGAILGSQNAVGSIGTAFSLLYIGAPTQGMDLYGLSIWNTALSDAQVLSIYNKFKV